MTREDRIKQFIAVHYKVDDSTKIAHLDTKEFLTSIQTKSEFTKYLSEKLVQQLKVDYVVIHHKCLITNILDLDPSLRNYSHEEADTGIVLNALDVSKRYLFTDLAICCSDTDALLILMYYHEQLTSNIVFKTTVHSYFVGEIYENLSPSIRNTLRISRLYWVRSNREIFWFWKIIVLDHINEFFKESFRRISRTRFT